ncbi:ABC transporter permease [Streptomyces sp. ISL-11]|uniref:ABC transporter permease n=1 Tax=Streptomyces sp. ISL-11 TaxID=2819174 RepID=UPI001BE5BFDF|nr:ABC transporter permease [Streptomyces sp. ISL-11]MBT2385407.1 ABC transporter permease [Streptomyces sp. ISL-11]
MAMSISAAGPRMLALGRAELILLKRNKMALYVALLMPLSMVWAMRRTIGQFDLDKTGMSVNDVSMTGAFGFILLFVVYQNLVSAYVARREELVLKRLRTGEAADAEILAGTALPALAIAVVQVVLLLVAGTVWLDLRAVARPDLLVVGLLLGLVLSVALAAVTTAWAKTVESAQLVTTPLLLVSLLGSGLLIPLKVMPDLAADVCELLPLTSVIELMRGGWMGGLSTYDALGHVGTALAWMALAVFAVGRWFRWEPRR